MKKIGKFNSIDENECNLKCNCGWNITIGGEYREDLKKLKKIIKKEFQKNFMKLDLGQELEL